MVACISPAGSNMLESKNTLNYANRAKNIKNKPVVNRDPRTRQILKLRERVKELETRLKAAGGGPYGGGDYLREVDTSIPSLDTAEQINQLQADLELSKEEVITSPPFFFVSHFRFFYFFFRSSASKIKPKR